MLQNNARIENLKGIMFYEQDMLYDNHTYSGDIQIVVQVDYVSPGFGFALLNNEGLALNEQKEVFLFKTGYRESTVIYKQNVLQKTIKKTSIAFEPPHNKMTFIFEKSGKNIKITCDKYDNTLLDYTLPNDKWDKYSIGFYSNAGNVIRSINIASSIPKGWTVNMHNTDGGYIRFYHSGFEFTHCMNNAEIEQEQIKLKAGTYYLKYDASSDSDIKSYIFFANDAGIDNKDKNILKGNTFTLSEDAIVNLKFAGKHGKISNINLCENPNDLYVGTSTDNHKIDGSYIEIGTDGVEYFTWTGYITSIYVPQDPSSLETSFVISDEDTVHTVSSLSLEFNKKYIFTYNCQSLKLIVEDYDDNRNIKEYNFYNNADIITIFKNMDAVITAFKIKKANKDDLIDIMSDNTNKKYVSKDVTSPIVVVDNEDIPLDLSSSYRIIGEGATAKYVFTNTEREIFGPDTYLVLEKKPSAENNKIRIYGIPVGAKTYPDKLYSVTNEAADTPYLYCPNYVQLGGDHIAYIDVNLGEIKLTNLNDYQEIIVDYEKKDSYCINYKSEINMYEVIISNEQQDSYLIYDEPVLKDGVYESETHALLMAGTSPMKPINKQYVVIRKE